jgi:copper chaperone NosL
VAFAATKQLTEGVSRNPVCVPCGMDQGIFSHNRMLIEYDGGSRIAGCSLHCVAIEPANTLDKVPTRISVADCDTRELLDADEAVSANTAG